MPKTLTDADIQLAAEQLGIDVASIRAVDEVESRGSGFLPDGRVRILFERHKFHAFTKGQFSAEHPDISNPKAGGYGKGGEHQYARFSKAFQLDPDAAMRSASWGRYQIMGFNFKAAGFDNVGQFVDAMKVSEGSQLIAFVNVIKSWGLTGELRNKDWAGFARQYNGAAYKKNKYDTKMAAAYEKFKAAPRQFNTISDVSVTGTMPYAIEIEGKTVDKQMDDKGVTTSPDKPKSETEGTPPPAPAMEVKASQPSLLSRLGSLSLPAGMMGVLGGVATFMQSIPVWVWVMLGSVALLSGVYLWNEAQKRAHERTMRVMAAAASPEQNNLRLV